MVSDFYIGLEICIFWSISSTALRKSSVANSSGIHFASHFSSSQGSTGRNKSCIRSCVSSFLQCVRGRGKTIFPYLPQIKDILAKSLRMKSKDGQVAGSIILRNLLRSMVSTFPEEYRSCPEGYDRPLNDFLPIRMWGKPGNIHNLQVHDTYLHPGLTQSFPSLLIQIHLISIYCNF